MAISINGTSGISGVDGSAGTPALQGTDTNTGISFGTDEVNINTGGTTRATVDSSGRLLVGTSSSSYAGLLTVSSNATSSTGHGILQLQRGSNATAAGNDLGAIWFGDGLGGNRATIEAMADAAGGAGDLPSRLVFSTTADGASAPTEQFRVHSTGTVSFGTTNELPADNNVSGAAFYRRQGLAQFSRSGVALTLNNTGGDGSVALFKRLGTTVGSISVSSGATAYNTSSDYRLKENIVPLTGAADRLNQLQVHRFNFIADPDKTVDGFIAHEAQAVVPECVTGEKDAVDADGNPEYQGIDQSKLVPLLTAALQEALAKIEALETRVAQLEGGTN